MPGGTQPRCRIPRATGRPWYWAAGSFDSAVAARLSRCQTQHRTRHRSRRRSCARHFLDDQVRIVKPACVALDVANPARPGDLYCNSESRRQLGGNDPFATNPYNGHPATTVRLFVAGRECPIPNDRAGTILDPHEAQKAGVVGVVVSRHRDQERRLIDARLRDGRNAGRRIEDIAVVITSVNGPGISYRKLSPVLSSRSAVRKAET